MELKNLSIKAKLYLIVIVILLPMILVKGYSTYNHYNRVMEFELEANHDFAEAVSLIFRNLMHSIGNELFLIGETILNAPDMNTEEISSKLKWYSSHNSAIIRYSWLNPDGTIIASSAEGAIGSSAQGRDYYNRILSGENFIVNEVVKSRYTNEPVFTVIRAVRAGTELKGILIAVIEPEMLNHAMPEQRVGASTSFGIADNNGIIVFRQNFPHIIDKMVEVNSQGAVRKVLDTGKPARVRNFTSAITNTPLSNAATPIDEFGWVAYANTDYQEIVAKAINSIKYDLLTLILASLLSLLLAIKIFRSILTPITSLQNFATQMSDANLDVRANIDGNDELAATGKALDTMAGRIKQLETSRRLFIESSAHELRNPMTGIKGIVSLIRKRIASGKPVGEAAQMLELAEKEVDRLSAILNQLLVAFKEQSYHGGKLTYKWEKVDLKKLFNHVISAIQAETEKHDVLFKLPDEHQVFIKGDAARIEDVLKNIISNAVKYSPGEKDIMAILKIATDNAIITVKDKGIGIPEDQLEHIFESFYRSDNLAENDPGGMGLGLYICREIILRHGGSIWAENNSDKGTSIFIKLPLYKEGDNYEENNDN